MYALDWRWLFVQPDTKALQLFLDKVLVCEGLEAVQAVPWKPHYGIWLRLTAPAQGIKVHVIAMPQSSAEWTTPTVICQEAGTIP